MNWAYIAGFFDGEGCLSKSWKRKVFQISISQAEFQNTVLFEIARFLESNGVASSIYTHKEKGRSRAGSSLAITSQPSVKVFLENVLPYCIVKKQKAVHVLAVANKSIARLDQQKANLRQAVDLFLEGHGLRTIEKKIGLCSNTLCKELKKQNIAARPIGTNQFSGVTASSKRWLKEYGRRLPVAVVAQRERTRKEKATMTL